MDFVTAVTNVGFPITLSLYLLVRFEKKMDDLIEKISGKDGAIDRIEEIRDRVQGCPGRKK